MTTSAPEATTQPVEHVPEVWALWDAGDLISLHETEQGASDAREAHLFRLSTWSAEDRDMYEPAVEITKVTVERP